MTYADIITKAVCGKGKKLEHSFHEVTVPHPISDILGCWVFNHRFNANKEGQHVIVEGLYDINIWYSYDHETKTDVAGTTFSYKDQIAVPIQKNEWTSNEYEVIVKVLQQPNCTDTSFNKENQKVKIKIERELLALVLGETKLKVKIADPADKVRQEQ